MIEKKKIMILGGGLNQISLFNVAKELGYYSILCDSKDNTICMQYCDQFIQIDISKSECVVEVAKKENVDGVVSNTESLMMCLSEVQTELNLIGNPVESINKLSNKKLFRDSLKKNGLFAPTAEQCNDYDEALMKLEIVGVPAIIKPEESSGSRGTYILNNKKDLHKNVFDDSLKWSRNNRVLIESFVDMSGKNAIEAEMFVFNGKIEHLFCFRTIRDKKYSTIPQCYCSAIEIDDELQNRIFDELSRIVSHLQIMWGEYNVELSFTSNNDIFIIEINSRQGGMRLPEFVRLFSGININKLLVSTATNDLDYLNLIRKEGTHINENVIHYRILCDQEGVYNGIQIDNDLQKYLVEEFFYYNIGDNIVPSEHSMASIGVLDFVFPDNVCRKQYETAIFDLINILVR